MQKKTNFKTFNTNRKAFHNYEILEKIEAGIALNGYEVKSIRSSNVNLVDALIRFERGEAFIENIFIAPYENMSKHISDYDAKRKRKLLLHKSQINKISTRIKEKGLTAVPLGIYAGEKGKIKVLLAIGKGKHTYNKKETIKRRDLDRDMEREKNSRKTKA